MDNEEQEKKCNFLGRIYTEKVAECLLTSPHCRYRISFGHGYLCTRQLIDHPDQTGQEAPTGSDSENGLS